MKRMTRIRDFPIPRDTLLLQAPFIPKRGALDRGRKTAMAAGKPRASALAFVVSRDEEVLWPEILFGTPTRA